VLQEARLITTGNFRDLQRNNIKMATKMMVENTRINDVIVKASVRSDELIYLIRSIQSNVI
jgi:hypothetical protein